MSDAASGAASGTTNVQKTGLAIREPSPGNLFRFGTPMHPGEIAEKRRHAGHHPILVTKYKKPFYAATHSSMLFYEYATFPNSRFTTNPVPEDSEYEVRAHRDGTHVISRDSSDRQWKKSKTPKPKQNGRRSINIRGQGFSAADLVLTSFTGPRPSDEHAAGHAFGVSPGTEPREAVHELSWLTPTQNMGADKQRAGTAGTPCKGRYEAIWARPLRLAEAPAAWSKITSCVERSDGHRWARFSSQIDAATILDVHATSISQHLRGRATHAGGFVFERDEIDEPLLQDRVLINETEQRYVTREGKLTQRKPGNTWIEFAQSPSSDGYVYITSPYEQLPGHQQMHRLVFIAFAPERVEAKIAKTRRLHADVVAELRRTDLTPAGRAYLEKLRDENQGATYSEFDIDHVNKIKSDNRLENLRILTRAEHMAKTHGHRVFETVTSDRQSARIATFATITEASARAGVPKPSLQKWLSKPPHSKTISYANGSTRHFHKE